MKKLCLVVLLSLCCTSLSRATEPENVFAACNEGNLEYVRQYLDSGGDPNARTLPILPVLIYFDDGKRLVETDSSTLLMTAVVNNHADIASLLLERGADPNQYSLGVTALYFNLLEMEMLTAPPDKKGNSQHADIDDRLRKEALASRKKIRDSLLSYGGISDCGPKIRREQARYFQRYLETQEGYVIYALCSPEKITFYHQDVLQQFDVPPDAKITSVWLDTEKKLADWLDTQKDINNLHIAIIGPSETEQSILWGMKSLCKEQNISSSTFVISSSIHCDALTLLEMFTEPGNPLANPQKPFIDYCPGPPIGLGAETEARLLAL